MIYSTYITVAAASKMLNLTVDEVHKLIDEGLLEIIEFDDGKFRILLGSVIKYKKLQDC